MGDELPVGWEEAYDSNIGRYYINHIAQSTQLEDPRQEWKSVQEQMLSDYLSAAQDQLENKREMYDVKQQRLNLAQEEYNHLNKLAASRSSCKYTQNMAWPKRLHLFHNYCGCRTTAIRDFTVIAQ